MNDPLNLIFSMMDDMYNYPRYEALCAERNLTPLPYPSFATIITEAKQAPQAPVHIPEVHVLTDAERKTCCGGGSVL